MTNVFFPAGILGSKTSLALATSNANVPALSMSRRPHVFELTAKLQELKAKEKELRAQARRVKRGQQKLEHRQKEHTKRHVDLGVATMAMLAPDTGWIPKFVRETGVAHSTEEFTEQVCQKFVLAPEEELTAILDPQTDKEARRLRRLRSFSTDYQLKNWVATQNTEKSVAPTIGDCIQRRDQLSKDLKLTARPSGGDFSLGSAATYKWLRRFRRRWKASMQQCGAREFVPLEETRKKARNVKDRGPTTPLDAETWVPKPQIP